MDGEVQMSKVNPYGECADCRFYFDIATTVGDCRRFSLRSDDWPKVMATDGCGEFMKLSDRQLSVIHGADVVSGDKG